MVIGSILVAFQNKRSVDMIYLLDNKSLRRFDVVSVSDYQLIGNINYNDKEYSVIQVCVNDVIYYFPVEGMYNGVNPVENKYLGGMDDPLKIQVDSCVKNSQLEEGKILSYSLNEMPVIGIPLLGVGLFGLVIVFFLFMIINRDYKSLLESERTES